MLTLNQHGDLVLSHSDIKACITSTLRSIGYEVDSRNITFRRWGDTMPLVVDAKLYNVEQLPTEKQLLAANESEDTEACLILD